ncbi:MAG: type II toxin-antitoxin system prevent-host-death family antitoxin [Actinomycetes bacterium]|jgi:prevent-host-death family protein|nr:type II toxin-antitoxin system prevent-host-death family antitoxin [Actinomycetes bacterium]
MLSMAIAEAKTQFSSVLDRVQAGEQVTITKGKARQPIAVIIPFPEWEAKKPRRELGTLAHLGSVTFAKDWKMTDEDFLDPLNDDYFFLGKGSYTPWEPEIPVKEKRQEHE